MKLLKDRVTGQVFFREYGEAPTNDGRKLFAIVGLIAVPETFVPKSEHQYTILGGKDGLELTILDASGVDVTDETIKNTLGNILQLPIWRC